MKHRVLFRGAALAGLSLALGGWGRAAAQQLPLFAHPAFERTWNRTDSLVAEGSVPRSWYWGPHPNTAGLYETLTDAPDGTGRHLVQYFDKSRMEINDPGKDANDPFYVTNGLLAVELIGGCIQTSAANACGEERYPADIPMSGDFGDTLAPTYSAFRQVANSRLGDHPAPDRRSQAVTATIDHFGVVGDDPTKASVPLTKLAFFEDRTKHNIPEAFWNFLNQTGQVREQGRVVVAPISSPWFYVTGLPISEAYWARATIAGQVKDVLIQAFERRVVTYTPSNPPAFQVEMGNIGQHYYDWRYKFVGQPAPGTGTPFATRVPTNTPGAATSTPVPATVTPSAPTSQPSDFNTPTPTGTTQPSGFNTPTPGP